MPFQSGPCSAARRRLVFHRLQCTKALDWRPIVRPSGPKHQHAAFAWKRLGKGGLVLPLVLRETFLAAPNTRAPEVSSSFSQSTHHRPLPLSPPLSPNSSRQEPTLPGQTSKHATFRYADDEVRRKLEQQLKRREDASTPTTTGDGDDEGNDSLDVDDADARCGALAPRRDPSRPGGDGPLRLALGYPDQLRRSL